MSSILYPVYCILILMYWYTDVCTTVYITVSLYMNYIQSVYVSICERAKPIEIKKIVCKFFTSSSTPTHNKLNSEEKEKILFRLCYKTLLWNWTRLSRNQKNKEVYLYGLSMNFPVLTNWLFFQFNKSHEIQWYD